MLHHVSFVVILLLLVAQIQADEARKGKKKRGKSGGSKSSNGGGRCQAQPSDYETCHPCGREIAEDRVVEVDYLIVGAGPAGLSVAEDLSTALRITGSDQKVAIVEQNDHIGGRFEDINLVEPEGYTGPPLRAGLGALRTNQATFDNLRRKMTEHDIQVYCSIFNNRISMRGRTETCGLQNECHIYGNFCTNAQTFVNDTNVDVLPYGAAFVGLTEVLERTGNPESSAIEYLIGVTNTNPATGDECDNSSPDPNKQCPALACKSASDYKTFVQSHLGAEFAELLTHSNVGFFVDQGNAHNACNYLEWTLREYDTLSINCYPEGGMSALTDAMYERGRANGVDLYLQQPALCIDRSGEALGSGNHHFYQVRTPDYTFKVKEFLFVATGTIEMKNHMSGDLVQELATHREFSAPKAVSVATVTFQWDPSQPAFWYDVVNKAGGTHSFRQYGDLECFARTELIDTPYHRQHNALRVVYTDYRCIDLWKELIEDAETTGSTDRLRDEALRGLRSAYPDLDIPPPILVKGKFWDVAWHWLEPLTTVDASELAEYAVDPTLGDECDSMCLVGEAWAALYYGWSESAFTSARNCLEARFDGILGMALEEIFNARDTIVGPFDDFDSHPGSPGFPILDNEHFAPFGCLYDDTDGSLLAEFSSGIDCGAPLCDAQGVPSA